jgi:hypothetical protein
MLISQARRSRRNSTRSENDSKQKSIIRPVTRSAYSRIDVTFSGVKPGSAGLKPRSTAPHSLSDPDARLLQEFPLPSRAGPLYTQGASAGQRPANPPNILYYVSGAGRRRQGQWRPADQDNSHQAVRRFSQISLFKRSVSSLREEHRGNS